MQSCPWPSCHSGTLHKGACKCNAVEASTCPDGFLPVKSSHGLCSCEKKSRPQCPPGLSTYGSGCRCTGNPTCPRGSTLSPSSASCTAEPTCPYGAELYHCKCVKEYVRQCSSGTLSWDGCECKTSYPPKCSKGCTLDSNGGCKCKNSDDPSKK